MTTWYDDLAVDPDPEFAAGLLDDLNGRLFGTETPEPEEDLIVVDIHTPERTTGSSRRTIAVVLAAAAAVIIAIIALRNLSEDSAPIIVDEPPTSVAPVADGPIDEDTFVGYWDSPTVRAVFQDGEYFLVPRIVGKEES